jgi:hypothetical protein
VERLAGYLLYPREGVGMTVTKVIKNDNLKTLVEQFDAGMRTNVSRSASDKDSRHQTQPKMLDIQT